VFNSSFVRPRQHRYH